VAQAVESTTPDPQESVEAPPPPKNEFEEDAPTRIHDGGALSAALFSMGERGATPPPAAAVEEWYVGINGSPVGPLTMAALRDKAASGEATGESLVWKDGFEDWKPLSSFPELAALVDEAKDSAPATVPFSPTPAPAPAAGAATAAAAAPRAAVLSETPDDMLAELGVKKRRQGSHPAAWFAVVAALGLGVTIGVVLFSNTETKKVEVIKIVEVEKPGGGGETPAPGGSAEVLEEATVSANGTTKRSAPSTAKASTPAPQASGASILKGLGGLDLGPAAGQKGPDVAGGSAPGGQLDGAAIQRVVANFTPSVRRGCWQPALEGRSPDAPSSARVSLAITVAASGNVQNVTTSGDPKGYPGLSRCIQSRVQSWTFPRSSGTTTVNVPFVFAAQ